MNRYIMVRRLRGPAFLLLVGALALLNQMDVLDWSKSWPLFLILWGVLMLVERAVLAIDGGYPPPLAPSQPTSPTAQPGYASPYTYPGQPTAYPGQSAISISPTSATEPVKGAEGDAQ